MSAKAINTSLQHSPRPLPFRRTPNSAFVRLVLCIFNMFLVLTPVGMTIYQIGEHGSSWNKVGWSEYAHTFPKLIIPLLAYGIVDWWAGEKERTTKPN